jgi:ABC-2 type transport system ATP-binding protein
MEPNSRIRFKLPGGADVLNGIEARVENGVVTIETSKPTEVLFRLTSKARSLGLELEELEVVRPTLEDMYLRLVGEAEAEEAEAQ